MLPLQSSFLSVNTFYCIILFIIFIEK